MGLAMTFKHKIKTDHKWIKIILEKWSCCRKNENMTTMTTFTLKSSIIGAEAGPLDMPPPVHIIN